MPKPPSDVYTPRELFEAVNNSFLASVRTIDYAAIPEMRRKWLRTYAETLSAGLWQEVDEGALKAHEQLIVLAVLLRQLVVKLHPTGLPPGAYRVEEG